MKFKLVFGSSNIFIKLPFLTLVMTINLITGCITPSEKKDMQSDIFNVQTRLLSLERQLTDTSKDAKNTGESASKRLATTQADLDRILHELQQMRGDIDTLRVGVITGQLPGQGHNETSLAAGIARLASRLDAVERNQSDLMDALKKAGLNRPKKTVKRSENIEELKKLYEERVFRQVIDDAQYLMTQGTPEAQDTARFLLAESYFNLGMMRESALKYSEILERKAPKEQLPLVKMHMGDSFRQLGDEVTAKVYYQELIRDHPESDEATKAKERLAGGGAKPAPANKDKG